MNDNDRLDRIRDLIKRRDDLEDRLERSRNRAKAQAGELGFWGVVGGVAIAADFMILGGIGTGIAVLAGASFVGNKREEKKLQKQLDLLDIRLDALQRERVEYERRHPKPDASLTDEFSPAAKKEIDLLRSRLEDLEKQMDKNTRKPEDKTSTVDKPRFKPPSFG